MQLRKPKRFFNLSKIQKVDASENFFKNHRLVLRLHPDRPAKASSLCRCCSLLIEGSENCRQLNFNYFSEINKEINENQENIRNK